MKSKSSIKSKNKTAIIFLISAAVGGFLFYIYRVLSQYFGKSKVNTPQMLTANSAISNGVSAPIAVQTVYVQRIDEDGTATFSSDGLTTEFSIAHTLAVVPTSFNIEPMTEDAQGYTHVTKNSTHIIVHYAVAPPEGSNNVVINYQIIK